MRKHLDKSARKVVAFSLCCILLLAGCGGGAASGIVSSMAKGGGGSKDLKNMITFLYPDLSSYDAALPGIPYRRLGLIDAEGKWVVQPTYDLIAVLNENGMFVFGKAEGAKEKPTYHYGVADLAGKVVVEPKYDYLFPTGDRLIYGFGDKEGLLDWTGMEITSAEYASIEPFVENLALATKDEALFGYLDKSGKWAIEPIFAAAFSFGQSGNADLIQKGGAPGAPRFSTTDITWAAVKGAEGKPLFGIIGQDGKWKVQPKFQEVRGTAAKLPGGSWGYVDEGGNWVIEPQFMDASPFSEGAAHAIKLSITAADFLDKEGNLLPDADAVAQKMLKSARYGLFDQKGKWLLSPKYARIYNPNKLGITVTQAADADSWEFWDKNRKPIPAAQGTLTDPILDGFNRESAEVMVLVKRDGQIGVINKNLELIVPFAPREGVSKYQMGDVIFRAVDKAQRVQFLLKGYLKLYDFSGKEIVVEAPSKT